MSPMVGGSLEHGRMYAMKRPKHSGMLLKMELAPRKPVIFHQSLFAAEQAFHDFDQ